MAKISIHIQDQVLDKIKPYKERINISRVCSSALLKEIEVFSAVPTEVANMQSLIIRLRKDITKRKRESFNLGMAMARLYSSNITYEELQEWGKKTYSNNDEYYFPEEVEDKIERYLLEGANKHPFDRKAFSQGWSTILRKTWDTVRNRV